MTARSARLPARDNPLRRTFDRIEWWLTGDLLMITTVGLGGCRRNRRHRLGLSLAAWKGVEGHHSPAGSPPLRAMGPGTRWDQEWDQVEPRWSRQLPN